MHYAGFWRRFIAYGVDASIVQLVAALTIALFDGIAHIQTTTDYQALKDIGGLSARADPREIEAVFAASGGLLEAGFSLHGFFIWAVISGVYNIGFVAGSWQATPGKRRCGMIVAMRNGARLTPGQSALRWFASFTGWASLGVGFMMAGWNREKCAMHDVICGTRVIYRSNH